MTRPVLTVDGFFPQAQALRDHFDERFADPRQSRGDRFVWDYWHVPGQYTLLRTPAYHYFPNALYRKLHEQLVRWGRQNLGCHDISPPWMSCYVEGCLQELHGDLPHGPWAFVYSLTPWQARRFLGGETLLLREEVLDFWSQATGGRGMERDDVFQEVEPRFNRLTVFDPRIPHGVREVRGVHDPREGRLVIHGWFVQPRPYVEGPLPARALQAALGELEPRLGQALQGALVQGVLTFRLKIAAQGQVERVQVLTDRLRAPGDQIEALARVRRAAAAHFRTWQFPKARAASVATVPLVFEASAEG